MDKSFSQQTQQLAITGIGDDRPGIVAALTEVLVRHGGNIEDTSMTILAGQFAMILIVSFPEGADIAAASQDFTALEATTGLRVMVKDLGASETTHPADGRHGDKKPHMVTVSGHDHSGITYDVARLLARFEINITDLNAQVIDGEDGPVYLMMMEVEVDGKIEFSAFQHELAALAQVLSVEIQCRPIDPVAF